MTSNKAKVLSYLLFSAFLSSPAAADWQLNNSASSLYYVTSKASAVSEVNSFTELSGSIDSSGKAVLQIDLNSVETAIEVRNQRVRDMLFEVAEFPQASAILQVDTEVLEDMPSGLSITGSYQVEVDLHGFSTTVTAELQLTKLSEDNIQVQLAMPLIINATTFGLAEGVEALREIAGLPSINNNVIMSFSLLFEQ